MKSITFTAAALIGAPFFIHAAEPNAEAKLQAAKVEQAKKEVAQIASAIKAYYNDHNASYPIQPAEKDQVFRENNEAVFNALAGTDKTINFDGTQYLKSAGSRDPWGNPYLVAFEAHTIDEKLDAAVLGYSDLGSSTVDAGFAVISYGPDRTIGTNGNALLNGSDDIVSFQSSRSVVGVSQVGTAPPGPETLPGLSLEQNRIAGRLISEVIPQLEADLQETVGSAIKFELDWKAIAAGENGLNDFEDALKNAAEGIKQIATDALGKQALAAKVKIVRLQFGDARKGTAFTVKDGVLTIIPWLGEWKWVKSDSVAEKVKALL